MGTLRSLLPVPRRRVSFAATTGLLALVSYVFVLSSASRFDWRLMEVDLRNESGHAKMAVGLLGGAVHAKKERVVEWKLEQKSHELQRERSQGEREEFLSFRYYTVGFYSVLILSTLLLALGTLFIIWSSKPSLNVLGSLVVFSISVFLDFCAVFLDLGLTGKLEQAEQCRAVAFEFLDEVDLKTVAEDCVWTRGKAPWLLWVGTAFSVAAWAVAVVRIVKYRLPFMAKAMEDIMAVKAMAADTNFDDNSSAAPSSPGGREFGSGGVRERIPLLN